MKVLLKLLYVKYIKEFLLDLPKMNWNGTYIKTREANNIKIRNNKKSTKQSRGGLTSLGQARKNRNEP